MPKHAKTIGEYMVPFEDYQRVTYDTTLHEALNIIAKEHDEKGYQWVIVLNENNEIDGFLTLRNIFEAVSNLALSASGMFSILTNLSRDDMFYLEGVQLIKDTPLKKAVMSLNNKISVHVDDAPGIAAVLMLRHHITIIPIRDNQDKIIGMVRPIDLLPYIQELFDHAPVK